MLETTLFIFRVNRVQYKIQRNRNATIFERSSTLRSMQTFFGKFFHSATVCSFAWIQLFKKISLSRGIRRVEIEILLDFRVSKRRPFKFNPRRSYAIFELLKLSLRFKSVSSRSKRHLERCHHQWHAICSNLFKSVQRKEKNGRVNGRARSLSLWTTLHKKLVWFGIRFFAINSYTLCWNESARVIENTEKNRAVWNAMFPIVCCYTAYYCTFVWLIRNARILRNNNL